MSHLTQMAGLTVQNFVSAAVGIAVAIALVRGHHAPAERDDRELLGRPHAQRRRASSCRSRSCSPSRSPGWASSRTLHGPVDAHTVAGATQAISRRPGREPGGDQGARHERRRASQRELRASVREPDRPHEPPRDVGAARDPVRAHVRLRAPRRRPAAGLGDLRRDARALGRRGRARDVGSRSTATRRCSARHARRRRTWRARRCASARPRSALFAASTTGTSTGAVNAAHDSFTPLGGAVPLVNMMLGEVSPGGVGLGALRNARVRAARRSSSPASWSAGRPSTWARRSRRREMKLVVLYILAVPALVLSFAARSVVLDRRPPRSSTRVRTASPRSSTRSRRPRTTTARRSAGSAATPTGSTRRSGSRCSVGRFLLIVPALAIAGSLARKQHVPATAGTFPTGTPLFAGLLVGVVLIVVGLTYFPVAGARADRGAPGISDEPVRSSLLDPGASIRRSLARCHRDERAQARPAAHGAEPGDVRGRDRQRPRHDRLLPDLPRPRASSPA